MAIHSAFYKKLSSKNTLFYLFCVLCMALVGINVATSQKYNGTMFGVMEGERNAIITYLTHIWGTPLFNLEMETYRAEERKDILSEWEKVESENANRIATLENSVRMHPYSPELYYNLSLLYTESGNKIKAAENLRKAQAIDPSIK